MSYNELFTYDPDTGHLHWKVRPLGHFPNVGTCRMWNKKYAGKIVGYRKRTRRGGKQQSPQVSVFGEMVYLHRIVWEMIEGPIPDGMMVDHRDGNNLNNVLANLRLTDAHGNARNRVNTNPIGLKGVTPGYNGKWRAQISVNDRNIALGSFTTKGLAAVAYAKAALRLHGSFARIR